MPRSDAASPLAASASATAGDALRSGLSLLAKSSGSARLDALILLEHILGRRREWIVAHGEAPISEAQLSLFMESCERRRRGEPIAYVTGSAWFYGREFIVDPSVLVPRPETEHLVDEATRFVRARGTACRVLDVGTGSGAIACSVAAETAALVDATDASPAAVALATRNAELLAVSDRCRFYCGDLASPVSGRRYDVVVANLPYVPTAELPAPPDPVSFEPREALDGGPDGLSLYRELLAGLANLLDERALVLLESAPSTIRDLTNLTQSALPSYTISVGSDYAGLTRYVKGAPRQV